MTKSQLNLLLTQLDLNQCLTGRGVPACSSVPECSDNADVATPPTFRGDRK